MRANALIALSAVLLLSACAPVAQSAADPFGDVVWKLASLNGEEPAMGDTPTLTLAADGRAFGDSGCNKFTGAWKREGDRLYIAHVASTKMACAGPAMQQETVYVGALGTVERFAMAGKGLELTTSDGAKLLFGR